MKKFVFALALAAACGGAQTDVKTPTSGSSVELTAALSNSARTDAEKARDQYRHPKETLEFFGLKPDMNVIELASGTGWYTAILAPVVADHGKLHVTSGDPNGPADQESTKRAKDLLDRFQKTPAVFGKVDTMVVDFAKENALGPAGSADMVLTFRNAHGWIKGGSFDRVLADIFAVLKSGGILGVTEHRAAAGVAADPQVIDKTGYVPESFVIDRATAAGFKLAGKSEINANAKDTKDYPEGVWTLPPTYRRGEVDHAKYQAIGESDRMTLKFVKAAKATPKTDKPAAPVPAKKP